MDELKLKLSTKFMRGIITKLLAKMIYKKLGYKIDILLNEIEINTVNDKVHLHVNVDAEVNKDEFMLIIKSVGLD